MAESSSAGCELQDENGKKASQLFKNSGLSYACTVIINLNVPVVNLLTHSDRCTTSGRYVRTNSTSKQVARGCIWTIVRTLDKSVSHKTKDKVRIFSTSNISPSFLTLGHSIYYLQPPHPPIGVLFISG